MNLGFNLRKVTFYMGHEMRELGDYEIAYLFIDGIAERIRPGQRREPVLAAWGFTVDGRKVAPVVWECNCLEEVCGACAMVINGRPRPACSALVEELEQPI